MEDKYIENDDIELDEGSEEEIEVEVDNEEMDEDIEENPLEIEVEGEDSQSEEADESDESDDTPEVEASTQEQKERMVPLSALEAERNKWKQRLNDPSIAQARAIADRLKQTTGKDYTAIQEELDRVQMNNYVDSGVDENMAKYIVDQQREMESFKKTLNKQKRDAEISELKQSNLYRNIEMHRDEVEEHADRTGLPLKGAYLDLFGESIFADKEREIEQRVLNGFAKKQSKKVDSSESGAPRVKSKVDLSNDELAVAKAAGLTPTEYFNLKNISSPDQYRKLKKK